MSGDETKNLWWVYFVRTPQNSLYCGITTNVERRFNQHVNGTGAKALRGKSPLELVWHYQVGSQKGEALRMEHKLKKLTKHQKETLITAIDPHEVLKSYNA